MVDKDYKIKGFRPNWPPKNWYDEYEGSIYTEASPERKKRHLKKISEDLLDEGYDWRQKDEITRVQGRIEEAEKIAKKAGAFVKPDGSWDTSQVETDEQIALWDQAVSIMDNVSAITGGPVIVKDQLMDNYPLSELHTEDAGIANFGEALWGTAKDVGADLWNMTRELGHYPLYGIPYINKDVEGFMDNYWPEIKASDKIEISPEEAYGNWRFYDDFKDNMGKNEVPGLADEVRNIKGFRWREEPAIDEDSWWSWLNQSEPEYDIVTGERIDDGIGWIRPSSVPDTNPWKKLMDKRIRPAGNIIPIVAALALTRGKGIIPLVNKLPYAMRKTIGQILPFTSGQGTMWPKYTGANKYTGIKNWAEHILKRDWWNSLRHPIKSPPTSFRNITYSLPTFGTADLMADIPYDFEPMSISDSWDREPVVFDSYMQNKLDNFEPTQPRVESRHPREMMEKSYGQSLHGEIDNIPKPKIGISFSGGPVRWGGGDI